MGRPVLIFIAVMACALVTGCGQSNPLQLTFPEGHERTYEISERREVEMSIPVVNQAMRQYESVKSTMRVGVVQSTENGPGVVRAITDETSAQFRMSFMGESVSFDDNDKENPIAKMAQAVIGEEIRVTVEPNGNIVAFEGVDHLIEKILAAQDFGGLIPAEMSDVIKDAYTDDQIRLSVQKSVLAHLPVTGVQRGATWTVTYSVTQPLPISVEDTYTVLNVYDDRVTIDVASVIGRHPTDSTIDFGGVFSMTVDARGEGEGYIEVDRATGWINEASTTLRIRGDCEFRGGGLPMPPEMGKVPITARVEIHSSAI